MEEEIEGIEGLSSSLSVVDPECRTVFVKVESLFIAVELITKLLACLVILAVHCELQ